MLAHIFACTGIRHTPYDRVKPRLGTPTVWNVVVWKTWSAETSHRHGKTPKARPAL